MVQVLSIGTINALLTVAADGSNLIVLPVTDQPGKLPWISSFPFLYAKYFCTIETSSFDGKQISGVDITDSMAKSTEGAGLGNICECTDSLG